MLTDCFFRYEDWKENLEKELPRVLNFLGRNVTDEVMKCVIDNRESDFHRNRTDYESYLSEIWSEDMKKNVSAIRRKVFDVLFPETKTRKTEKADKIDTHEINRASENATKELEEPEVKDDDSVPESKLDKDKDMVPFNFEIQVPNAMPLNLARNNNNNKDTDDNINKPPDQIKEVSIEQLSPGGDDGLASINQILKLARERKLAKLKQL